MRKRRKIVYAILMKIPVFLAMERSTRQIIIAVIFFVTVLILGAGVYFAFLKAPATCTDGRQNQKETGIDCGGECAACKENVVGENLVIQEVAFVPAGSGRYDVLGKIYNPNDTAGASSFQYVFELKDATGKVLVTRPGKSFILPQESKYLMELNLESAEQPVSAAAKISDIAWERLSGYREKPAVNIYQKRYNQISSGAGFGEAFGLLSNESPYDFRSIGVKVILRDSKNIPLAFNMTEMNTISSGEERDFRLVWPTSFPGTVEKVEMEVDADVYHSDNFLRQYLPGGKFQEFSPPPAF